MATTRVAEVPPATPLLTAPQMERYSRQIILEEIGVGGQARLLRAKVLVIGVVIRLADPVGAGLALIIWLFLLLFPVRLRIGVAGLVLCAYVVGLRLEPFTFQAVAHEFGWIPFHSFLYGSLELNVVSFLEKAFLYGALIWLLHRSGLRLAVSTGLVATTLFLTSWAETYLPDRSAEITDALMALLIGAIIAVVKTPTADLRRRTAKVKQAL